jgi:hypothetical protein
MVPRLFTACLLYLCLLLCPAVVRAQRLCNQVTADMQYTVQSVRINARWVSPALQRAVEQAAGLGAIYDPARISEALVLVREEIEKTEGQPEFRLLKGSTSVLYLYAQSCAVGTDSTQKLVAVEITPVYLRIDLFNAGNNLLPVPRSARPSFYQQVPEALKIAAPMVSFSADRRYGPAAELHGGTDLLHLPGKERSRRMPGAATVLVDAWGRKSFQHAFYSFGGQAAYARPVYTDSTPGWNMGLQWHTALQPWGNGRNQSDHFFVQAGLQGTTRHTFLHKWAAGLGARFSHNRFSLEHGTGTGYREAGGQWYAMADGMRGSSFTRVAAWFDAAVPGKGTGLGNYQRAVTRLGYSRFLGSGHNTALIEAVAGAGYAWGNVPVYSRYFAGNAGTDFLYAPLNGAGSQAMPGGPLVRSLGEHSGGVFLPGNAGGGGKAFWHLNLNFSVPVARWAKPLIPDITLSEQPRRTLRSALKGQANTAANFIYDDLVSNHGYPDNAATDSVAQAIVDRDIRPALNYLADRSNGYAVKPVLLFDVSQLLGDARQSQLFTAAGLGVQLTVVVARLELGYMHTLSPAAYTSGGNFFVHIVLQNFY